MRKRYRVLVLAALVAALCVPVGYALSIDSTPKAQRTRYAVVIPAAALQNSQAGNYVYVLTPDQTVEMRPVIVGAREDREIAIEKGLRGGDKVVTEGHLRLSPGAKVKAAS